MVRIEGYPGVPGWVIQYSAVALVIICLTHLPIGLTVQDRLHVDVSIPLLPQPQSDRTDFNPGCLVRSSPLVSHRYPG